MKVLLITHGVFLDPAQVVTGNSVRAYYLAKGLVESGQSLVYVYPGSLSPYAGSTAAAQALNIPVHTYKHPDHLSRIIEQEQPDVLLVGYWELLADLPPHNQIPVILDLVAPRVLEALFQPERDLQQEIHGILELYPRADLFLVGNQRQRHLLLPWLIMAGIDCKEHVPVAVVPISTQPGNSRPYPPDQDKPWRFVSGGVSWPWRRTQTWFEALAQALANASQYQARLELFSGNYIYAPSSNQGQDSQSRLSEFADLVQTQPLLPYTQMQEYLRLNCHIGLELADQNLEREYSQSFRAIEFLRSGLPIICNEYLKLAESIHHYDAGWIVRSPEELQTLIPEIMAKPELWRQKSDNALRLVQEEYNYARNVRPLLDFIHHPLQPEKGRAVVQIASQEKSSAREAGLQLRRDAKDWKQGLISLAGKILRKIAPQANHTPNIILVSRADIFPADHGAAVKIDRTAAALSRFANKVHLLTDDRRYYFRYQNGSKTRHRYPIWLSLLAPLRLLVRRKARKKGIPINDAFLYYPLFDWSYILRTLYIALRYSVRIFQAEFPAYARPCLWGRSLLGGKALLAEHNVEYQRLKEQNPDLSLSSYAFVRQTELTVCNQVDHVVTVSKNDKQQLIQDGVQSEHIHYIPHGVDLEAFDQSESIAVRDIYNLPGDEPLFVYHGTYLYPPNMEAVTIMAEEIMPQLRQWGIQAKLLAVGPNPPEPSPWPEIVFTGSVEQVAPYLRAADMAVVPLRQGGGTRMKILDYFAASLPVVCTAKGIEGIEVSHGKHAQIVDKAGIDFALAIQQLLADPEQAGRIGHQGRKFAEQLDWKIIGKKYMELMQH